jgi:hypothetical protein
MISVSRNWCERAGKLLSAIPRYRPSMLGTGNENRCETDIATHLAVVIAVDIRDIQVHEVLGEPGNCRSLPTMTDVRAVHFAAGGGEGCSALVRCDSSPGRVMGGLDKYFDGDVLSSELQSICCSICKGILHCDSQPCAWVDPRRSRRISGIIGHRRASSLCACSEPLRSEIRAGRSDKSVL